MRADGVAEAEKPQVTSTSGDVQQWRRGRTRWGTAACRDTGPGRQAVVAVPGALAQRARHGRAGPRGSAAERRRSPGIRGDRSGRPAVLGELGAGRRSGRPRRARRRLPGGRARGRRGHGRRPAAPAILGTRGRHRGRDPRTAEARGHRPAPGQRGAPVGEPADAGLAAAGHRRGHRRVAVRLPAARLALGADLRRAGRHRRHHHPVADGVQGPGGRPADQGPEAHPAAAVQPGAQGLPGHAHPAHPGQRGADRPPGDRPGGRVRHRLRGLGQADAGADQQPPAAVARAAAA